MVASVDRKPVPVELVKDLPIRNRGMLGEVSVSVVIPALNEAENLDTFCREFLNGWTRSSSSTVARQTAQLRSPGRFTRRFGLSRRSGRARVRPSASIAAATGDIIVMLDADGSTDPREIPIFVGPLLAGADFVKGSRFLQGGGTADMGFLRRAGNWFFTKIVQWVHGGRYSDLCYGYNAFWARVLPQLKLDGDGFEIETVMNVRALRAGLKVVEVPSFEQLRIHGESHLRTFPDGWRVLKAIGRELRTARTSQGSPDWRADSHSTSHEARSVDRRGLRTVESNYLVFGESGRNGA